MNFLFFARIIHATLYQNWINNSSRVSKLFSHLRFIVSGFLSTWNFTEIIVRARPKARHIRRARRRLSQRTNVSSDNRSTRWLAQDSSRIWFFILPSFLPSSECLINIHGSASTAAHVRHYTRRNHEKWSILDRRPRAFARTHGCKLGCGGGRRR